MDQALFTTEPTGARVILPPVGTPIPAVGTLVDQLPRAEIGDTYNFYAGDDEEAAGRRERLCRYLHARWADATIVLVGEAAGYRGARLSGIAFTSVAQLGVGTTNEASATIVHRTLAELGIEERVLLWNVVPTHPHRPGDDTSNRRPTAAEIAAGAAFLDPITDGRTVVAVGRVAEAACRADFTVRHPAHGGAAEFAAGLSEIVRTLGGVGDRRGGSDRYARRSVVRNGGQR